MIRIPARKPVGRRLTVARGVSIPTALDRRIEAKLSPLGLAFSSYVQQLALLDLEFGLVKAVAIDKAVVRNVRKAGSNGLKTTPCKRTKTLRQAA